MARHKNIISFFSRTPINVIFTFAVLFFGVCPTFQSQGLYKNFPYMIPELTLGERVNDLVNRTTREGKISQLPKDAPAIERQGINSAPVAYASP